MKTHPHILAIVIAVGSIDSYAQNIWTQKADFGGVARGYAVGFSIGNKGYIGTGNNFSNHRDFWEYDSATGVWTQKADFGGTARLAATGFSIGSKGYIGTGCTNESGCVPGTRGLKNDFWEYNPSANSWTRKADFKGEQRMFSVGFSIGGKGYIGTGLDREANITVNDLWEYDPATDSWTQKANVGGPPRHSSVGFSIGSKGYIGAGNDNTSYRKDFWEYDPVADAWTEKADFSGEARAFAAGFSIGNKGYIGTGNGTGGETSFLRDFYEYDPAADAWTRKADFGGTGRYYATGLSIDGKGYIGTGYSNFVFTKDFWEYTPGENTGSCLPPPAGLVSWWSGDKTAEDVQGTNPGRLVGDASYTRGMVGPGFVFDGVDDAVVIPNSASLSPAQITLDAWVYPTGKAGTNRHIISKDNELRTREYILGATFYDTFNANIWLTDGTYVQALGTTPIQLNTWYHVAMTHDGTKLDLYVNGVLEATADAVGNRLITVNPVGIGGNSAPVFFQGIIDEAQIFNRALSDAEILAIYQAGADGQCKPDIFVASINPFYTVSGHGFRISTSIVIQDVNGVGINDATVQLGVILPSGSALTFPLKTDATGQADVSFTVADSGLYQFKVRNVNHPIREYDPSLNIETSDTLLIP